MNSAIATRVCTRCHETKPLSDFFHSTRNAGDGYASICLSCVADAYAQSKPRTDKLIQEQTDLAERQREEVRSTLEKERAKKAYRPLSKRAPASIPDIRTARAGSVYLLVSENGLYKIGRTINVGSRVGDLNRSIPVNVRLVHSIKSVDYILAEEFLHTKFADRWVKYEWFNLSQADVEWLCSLADFGLDQLLPARSV